MALDRSPELFAHLFLCFSSIFSVLVISKCGRLSWPALWSTFRRTIKQFDLIRFDFSCCASCRPSATKAATDHTRSSSRSTSPSTTRRPPVTSSRRRSTLRRPRPRRVPSARRDTAPPPAWSFGVDVPWIRRPPRRAAAVVSRR